MTGRQYGKSCLRNYWEKYEPAQPDEPLNSGVRNHMKQFSILGQSAQRFAAKLLPAATLTLLLVSPVAAQPGGLEPARARLVGRLRGFAGVPGHLRQSHGPGWALVGDAGYFKDPLTAHGITDALRDAELLARAILDGRAGALEAYQVMWGEILTAP